MPTGGLPAHPPGDHPLRRGLRRRDCAACWSPSAASTAPAARPCACSAAATTWPVLHRGPRPRTSRRPGSTTRRRHGELRRRRPYTQDLRGFVVRLVRQPRSYNSYYGNKCLQGYYSSTNGVQARADRLPFRRSPPTCPAPPSRRPSCISTSTTGTTTAAGRSSRRTATRPPSTFSSDSESKTISWGQVTSASGSTSPRSSTRLRGAAWPGPEQHGQDVLRPRPRSRGKHIRRSCASPTSSSRITACLAPVASGVARGRWE